jgi:hypothetical protein
MQGVDLKWTALFPTNLSLQNPWVFDWWPKSNRVLNPWLDRVEASVGHFALLQGSASIDCHLLVILKFGRVAIRSHFYPVRVAARTTPRIIHRDSFGSRFIQLVLEGTLNFFT